MEEMNKRASQAIYQLWDRLVEAIVDRLYKFHPELARQYGENGHEKHLQEVNYHLSHLTESIAAASPALFEDYVAWAKVVLTRRSIPVEYLAVTLRVMAKTIPPQFPEAELGPLVSQYIEAGLEKLPQFPSDLRTFIHRNRPLAGVTKQYVEALLQANRQTASRLILEAVQSGVSPQDIYLYVFQPALYEMGRLWETNRVSLAHEHYAAAVTQLIMSQLFPSVLTQKKNGLKLVATCVAGELHEIGVRTVADFLEMEGWDTFYFGGNTPAPDIIEVLIQLQAHVLALSATMTFHLRAVEETITKVRSTEACQHVKILVGGRPFRIAPRLWQQVGADGYASDARQAVAVINRLGARGEAQ